MDKSLVSIFTDELLAGEYVKMRDYFREIGAPILEITWSPVTEDLDEAVLRFLLSNWHGLPRGLKLPPAS